jgi:hypothetical protein
MNVVKELQKYKSTDTLDNIYTEPLKAKNLDVYLSSICKLKPQAILVGESPSFHGSQKTGIPFTDEYNIGNEEISLLHPVGEDGYEIENEYKDIVHRERASGIIWQGLELSLDNIVLWNILPFYIHELDSYEEKRSVLETEGEKGYHFLELVLEDIPSINVILVAGAMAAHIISMHEELKDHYQIFYVSHPNLSSKDEFIVRVKKALEYKENVYEQQEKSKERAVAYEYRKRWADTDETGAYYCRALNQILDPSMTEYCQYCPCNLREKLYCGYYDFSRNLLKLDGLKDVKRRFDLLIQVNLIPFFPDYIIRHKKGELLIEHAYQYAAKVYRDRVDDEENIPYLFKLMSIVTPMAKEIKKLGIEHDDEIIVAILFHNILYDAKVASGRIAKDYGEYTRTLVDRDAYRHKENLVKVVKLFEENGLPEDMIATFKKLFQMEEA